jgi:protein arginine kinase activator
MSSISPLRVCTHCGFTYAEFRAHGLLGCAECYAGFGDALFADLLHLHPRLHRRAQRPPETRDDGLAALRERFSDALRRERYEEAADLRERLRNLGVTP